MARTSYETFPPRLVLLSVLVTASVYALGVYVLWGFTALTVSLYIGFCACLELLILKESCIHCYYYGKVCGFGRGRLAALLFRRGDPRRFLDPRVCGKDVVPALMVALLPLTGGLFLLMEHFSLTKAGGMLALLLVYLGGNVAVRRGYACKYCKQKEQGCPALATVSRGIVA